VALLDRLRGGLARTREVLETPLQDLARGRRPLDAEALEEVEQALIGADLGLPAVGEALELLRARSGEIARGGIAAMRALLRAEFVRSLERPGARVAPFSTRPWVVFVVGVNGAGKTTTIGKLAAAWSGEGRSVLLCAADTFRAAAAEQLEVWSARASVSFHRGAEGADPSAVLTDALRMAKAQGKDAVLVDTAGRLHTKSNLMEELAKIRRTIAKRLPEAQPEVVFVLDATTGQNGLNQAKAFHESAGLTGIILTKLDTTSRGGIAFAIEDALKVPVLFVGVGEKIDDLLDFDPNAFVEALFA
jgi:fused signal recognition particle receptor